MAKLEITASNEPRDGREESRLWSRMRTCESPAKRFRAACSMAGRRKIDRYRFRLRVSAARQCQQTPISRPQIENSPSCGGDELQQRRLALAAMRNQIRPLHVIAHVFRRLPKIHRIASRHAREYRENV